MIAEILSTGDEICSGAIIDSNSAHIAEKLMELDIEVTRHSCVGDDLDALAGILKEIGAQFRGQYIYFLTREFNRSI